MTGHRARLTVGLALLAVLTFALPAAKAAQTVEPAAVLATKQFLPLVGVNFPAPVVPLSVRFWADRYALDAGMCTTLHWVVSGAKSVTLSGEAVAPSDLRQVCPAEPQFYILDADEGNGNVLSYELDVTIGAQDLLPSEVIAQAAVQSVSPVADIDPNAPGNQAGYHLQLTSVVRLYAADASWNAATVTLAVPQALIDLAPNLYVHWPIKAGQQVEFRANCDGPVCMAEMPPSYVYLRSE